MSALSPDETLELLTEGTLEMEGLISWSSNYTFLARVCREVLEMSVVYKPQRGERPLWDFPAGTLCQRERAAFLVSEALGWGLVPETVLRDGPHGWGSVQRFIEHDPAEHYFTFQEETELADQLQQVVLFDILVNNADRKGGHLLLDEGQRVWSIDHGICFHHEYKLRSVVWDFVGKAIPEAYLAALRQFQARLAEEDDPQLGEVRELLSQAELRAMERRLSRLLRRGRFPQPGPGRHYPWPPV